MNFQAISNSSAEPDSKPRESWKIKLLPGYVISSSISCRPLCCHWNKYIHTSLSNTPQVMASDESQMVLADYLQETQQLKKVQSSDQLTILVIYDGFCSLCYTTNLLKDGCLACPSPSNDKNMKVWAQVFFPEHLNMCLIWI